MLVATEQQPRATSAVHHISTLPSRASAGAWLGSRWFYGVKLAAASWGLVIFFAFIDAVASGGISLILRYDGWTLPDQLISRLYQFCFGAFVITTTLVLYARARKVVLLASVLLFGLWEDVLYYLLLPIAWPVIEFIIRDGWTGPGYGGIHFPGHIAGWPHWVLKVMLGIDVVFLPLEWVLFSGATFLVWMLGLSLMIRIATREVRRAGPFKREKKCISS